MNAEWLSLSRSMDYGTANVGYIPTPAASPSPTFRYRIDRLDDLLRDVESTIPNISGFGGKEVRQDFLHILRMLREVSEGLEDVYEQTERAIADRDARLDELRLAMADQLAELELASQAGEQ